MTSPAEEQVHTHAPKRSWRRRGGRWVIIILSIYVCWCVLLYFMQDRMMFPRDLLPPPTPEGAVSRTTERLWLDTADGHRVESWFLQHPDGGRRGVVFCTHGNAEIIDQCLDDAAFWHERGFHVILCEYRGYGRSGGHPGERVITADLSAFHDLIAARPDVEPSRILAHGRSIGAAAAAQLASRRPIAGLVLESPFRSATAFALRMGAPPFLLKSPFRTDRVLKSLDRPVILLHGVSDTIIPISHSRALSRIARRGTLVELPGDHNSGISSLPQFADAVDKWLQLHELANDEPPRN